MSTIAPLAGLAATMGEPARTAMLVALIDGRALTAGELAAAAGVAASTASGHLAQLLDAGLVALERQGRHRYFRLANPAVATTLEGMMALDATLANGASRRIATGPRDRALRRARVCYDHLAGEIAVGITDAMIARGELDFSGAGAMLTAAGQARLDALGVDPTMAGGKPRAFCRPCLDWSERRPHVAGAVGAALFANFVDRHWMRRSFAGRAVTVTPVGLAALERAFGVRVGVG